MPVTLPAAAAEIGMLSSDVDYYFTKVEGDIMYISDAIKVRPPRRQARGRVLACLCARMTRCAPAPPL